MGSHQQHRFVIKSLLVHKGDVSVCAAAGRAAMITFGGRTHRPLRASANPHLQTFAELLQLLAGL